MTDIYMVWDDMSLEDLEAQTGHNTCEGKLGYLRACAGMTAENGLLRNIFPEEYWENDERHGLPFDFIHSSEHNVEQIMRYVDGKGDHYNPFAECPKIMQLIISGAISIEGTELSIKSLEKKESRNGYACSVVAYLKKGAELQVEGKNPRVLIRWK